MKISIQHKRWLLLFCVALTSVCSAATSPIGRPVKFYESSGGRIVNFALPSTTCTPTSILTCFSLDAFGGATFRDIEVASVTASASTGRSTLCANPHAVASYAFKRQASAGEDLSTYLIQYRYEIESAVLNDASLINPRTGQPFNGKIAHPSVGTTNAWFSLFIDQDYLGPQQRLVRSQKINSFDCATSTISHSILVNTYGLSSTVAQRVMAQPVTIRMFIMGSLVATDGGSFSVQLRMLGD